MNEETFRSLKDGIIKQVEQMKEPAQTENASVAPRTGELIGETLIAAYEQFARMIESDLSGISKLFLEYQTAAEQLAAQVREMGTKQASVNQDWMRKLQESTERLNEIARGLGL